MSNKMVFGKYYPGKSPVHRADPRVKTILILVIMYAILTSRSWPPVLLSLLLSLVLLLMSKLPLKPILQSIKPIIFVTSFAFLINAFTVPGRVIFQFWRLTVTAEGLHAAFLMSFRLLMIVVDTSILLTLTTTPMRLADGLESLMKPLSKLGFPGHEIAMMMSIALRFVPTLLEETDKIMKAQSSRGADYDAGGIIKKAKGFSSVLVPLFISSLRRADELAQAMEARCYRGGEGRTKLHPLKYSLLDLYFGLSVLFACCLVLYLQWL